MVLNYKQKENRKNFVEIVSEVTGEKAIYLGAPTFSYKVGDYIIINKDGNIEVDDNIDLIEIIKTLEDYGFIAEREADYKVSIGYPRSYISDEGMERFKKNIELRKELICKALGIDELPIEDDGKFIHLDWFEDWRDPEDLKAYQIFVQKLFEHSEKSKRVNDSVKESDNQKYTFRCWLLRLGLIGDEYKEARRVLLRNLSGSAAFRTIKKDNPNEEQEDDEPVIKTEIVAKLRNPENAICM